MSYPVRDPVSGETWAHVEGVSFRMPSHDIPLSDGRRLCYRIDNGLLLVAVVKGRDIHMAPFAILALALALICANWRQYVDLFATFAKKA
jgi:hypothetical protein